MLVALVVALVYSYEHAIFYSTPYEHVLFLTMRTSCSIAQVAAYLVTKYLLTSTYKYDL